MDKVTVSTVERPPYGHPVNTVTLLLRPVYSGLNKKLSQKNPLNGFNMGPL